MAGPLTAAKRYNPRTSPAPAMKPAAAGILTSVFAPVDSPVCGEFVEASKEEVGLVVLVLTVDAGEIPKVAANSTPVPLSQHALFVRAAAKCRQIIRARGDLRISTASWNRRC